MHDLLERWGDEKDFTTTSIQHFPDRGDSISYSATHKSCNCSLIVEGRPSDVDAVRVLVTLGDETDLSSMAVAIVILQDLLGIPDDKLGEWLSNHRAANTRSGTFEPLVVGNLKLSGVSATMPNRTLIVSVTRRGGE
ncbi:hypothetical protein [Pirellulimonas nuda]|nr:hypothetical protein [Pirellulimonas nuda]